MQIVSLSSVIWENKKNQLSSAEFAQRVVKLKEVYYKYCFHDLMKSNTRLD